MTCNSEYFRPDDEDGVTSNYVLNFYGTQPFRVAEEDSSLAQWHQIGQAAMLEMEWFQKDDNNLIHNNYVSEYFERTSYQSCTAVAPLYMTKNGESVVSSLNKKYGQA